MKRFSLTFVALVVPIFVMAQGVTNDEIKRNLPTGQLILTAKPSDIDGYELTVSYVNRTNHVVYLPPFGAGTTTAKAYVKHGKTYHQLALRPPFMAIHPTGQKVTDFMPLSPGQKNSFTIFLNRKDIEGQGQPTKFDLTWSQNLTFSDGTQKAFRLEANSAYVKD